MNARSMADRFRFARNVITLALPLAAGGLLLTVWHRTGAAQLLSPPKLRPTYFGSPLPDLDRTELARFEEGLSRFSRVWSVQEGLGPLYNAATCADCHVSPLPGGSGVSPDSYVTLFGRTEGHSFDPLTDEGGPVLQRLLVPQLLQAGFEGERIPAKANCTSLRKPPPLFGVGLIERVPAGEILSRSDPDDGDSDGISGRPNRVGGRLARFGWKAQVPTLREFVAQAFQVELGLSNPVEPQEPLPTRLDAEPSRISGLAEPDIDESVLDSVTDFLALLDAPPQHEVSVEAQRGERIFHRLGCAACHVPELRTGPDEVAALDRKPLRLYSDLLLHDLGSSVGDCVQQADAGPGEFRTAPLWGVGSTGPPYLHGGQAADLAEAIDLHGGEASPARTRYFDLSQTERRWLLAFLESR